GARVGDARRDGGAGVASRAARAPAPAARAGPATRLVRLDQPLTKLGVPKLWGEEAERLWPIARLLAIPPILAMTRGAGYGLERVPRVGGAVVAANHFSGIDHPLIAIFCPR